MAARFGGGKKLIDVSTQPGKRLVGRPNVSEQGAGDCHVGCGPDQKTRAVFRQLSALILGDRNELRAHIEVGEQVLQEKGMNIRSRMRVRRAIVEDEGRGRFHRAFRLRCLEHSRRDSHPCQGDKDNYRHPSTVEPEPFHAFAKATKHMSGQYSIMRTAIEPPAMNNIFWGIIRQTCRVFGSVLRWGIGPGLAPALEFAHSC